jgi:hypothetical protein
MALKGKSFLNEPMKFEILDGVLDYNISGKFEVQYLIELYLNELKASYGRYNSCIIFIKFTCLYFIYQMKISRENL